MNMERVMGIGEASRELGVHIDTLRAWADAGVVCCSRTFGGHRRWTDAQLTEIKAAMGMNDDGETDTADGAAGRKRVARPANA